MTNRTIQSIIPAEGWGALFDDDDGQFMEPLAGWALVKDGPRTQVVGLIANEAVELCDEQASFVAYINFQNMMAQAIAEGSLTEDDHDHDEDADDDDDDTPPGFIPPNPPKRPGRSRLN